MAAGSPRLPSAAEGGDTAVRREAAGFTDEGTKRFYLLIVSPVDGTSGMRTNITDDDEGKRVVNADGEQVGLVKQVSGGTAHIDPDPGLTDKIKSKLGWGDMDEDTYPLQEANIDAVTDGEVRLKRDL